MHLSAEVEEAVASPFLGWNSYDCYSTHIDDRTLRDNLDAFIERLKPHGYDYFVIDAGWYRHYSLKDGESWPSKGDEAHFNLDEFGRYIPSERHFPEGLKGIIDYAHNNGVKFGLHLMRGIPREAVDRNLPIKGTEYRAQDIANTDDVCSWSTLNYGIDMSKPGAQAYYDSVVELAASWGVDFIKYDDIVHKPEEINAVADALEKCERPIILSLSPGDDIDPSLVEVYKRADMIRATRDIWDLSKDIAISFERWESIEPFSGLGFWIDLDMIPFGHIKITHPLTRNRLFAKRGYERMDNFSYAQKKTFMTQRAMAASPLFMGGSLVSSPDIVFELLTNAEMLACNQNGVTGKLQLRIENYGTNLDIWRTPSRSNPDEGWIGIFNRNEYLQLVELDKVQLGLRADLPYELYDIWSKKAVEDTEQFYFEVPREDVLFLRYKLR